MRKWLLPLFIIAALLIAAVPAAAKDDGPRPWFGEPDPFACNEFEDCFWTLEVCIEGVTSEVGIYYDPAEATAEQIAEDALFWSGIELTVGACQYEVVPVCEEVVYSDALENYAHRILDNRVAAYTGGLVACTEWFGLDYGGNCRSLDPFAPDYLAPQPGEFVCPAPAPDTGE